MSLVLSWGTYAEDPQPRPSTFYGSVSVEGSAVPAGTPVSATIDGVILAQGATFDVGGSSAFLLDVPADVPDTGEIEGGAQGEPVLFRVAGAAVAEEAAWTGGELRRVDLTAAAGTDLAVAKDDGVGSAAPGESLLYTVTVSNLGPFPATGVVLEDPVPADTVFISASDGGLETAGVVTWPPFSLAVGQSVTRTLAVAVAGSFPAGTTAIVNAASVRSDGADGVDPVAGNNSAIDSDALAGGPDLAVTKTADLTAARPGDDVVYSLTVTNSGFQPASVQLVDTLPAEVVFLTASNDGLEVGGVVSWPAVTVGIGESVQRTVRVRLPESVAASVATLVNTAEATSAVPDLDPGDNVAVHQLPVVQLPDLVAVAVDPGLAAVDPQSLAVTGEVAVSFANLGNAAVAEVFAVTLFEDLDGDGAFTPGGDNLLGEATVAAGLGAGASGSVSIPISGELLFRNSLLWGFVDSGGVVAEHDESNNLDHSGRSCGAVPLPEAFSPVVELEWPGGLSIASPGSIDSLSTPLVVNLDDDNGDGAVDALDVPEIVFVTYDLESGGDPQPRLRAIRGDSGEALWDVAPPLASQFLVFTTTGAAAADIDLDGRPEIVVSAFDVRSASGRPNRLLAYEHTGVLKWVSEPYSTHPDGDSLTNRDNPSIADLDGDGVPEVVVGANVFDADGALRWAGSGGQGYQSARNEDGFDSGAISIVADLDLSEDPEVVTGNTAYHSDGTVYWQLAIADGYPAVGNFDADDFPEVVVVSRGNVRLHQHDGTPIWTVELPGAGAEAGGAPTVADFDGDGEPEIGVAGSTQYAVFERDGSVRWQTATQDGSSNMTGSTVFDLDGDGRFEVIYRDETALRVYRGADGVVLYELPLSSITLNEEVVVADVDRDGNAEIVATSDSAQGVSVPLRTRGLRVIGDAGDNWVAARPIWNQHAYHVDNVEDDGSIPAREAASWLAHNTYRANLASSSGAFASPDLSASRIVVDVTGFPAVTATVRVGNGGSAPAPAGTPVAFYDADPAAAGALLAVVPLAGALAPGSFTEVAAVFEAAGIGAAELFVVADDDGGGIGTLSECAEANNVHGIAYDTGALGLLLTLEDGESAVQPGEVITYTLTISNGSAFARTGVAVSLTLSSFVNVVAVSDGGAEAAGVVSWPGFDLAGGATATRTLTLEVDSAIPLAVTEITQTATVTDDGSQGPDPTPSNNTDTDTNAVLTVRADAGGPYSGEEGSPIAFDASGSSDRDGTIVLFEWDLDGDGVFDDATGVTASRTFDDDASFVVAVRVTDDSGETDVDATEVVIDNVAPLVDSGPDLVGSEGQTIDLDAASFVDAGAADIHSASVDWGDGTIEPVPVEEAGGSGTVVASHIYADDGSFIIELCVADDEGASTCDAIEAVLENEAPTIVEEREVDLREWEAEWYRAESPSGLWVANEDGTEVRSAFNNDPSFFYSPFSATGSSLNSLLRVNAGDDDYFGFVIGFAPGDTVSSAAEFLLVDWKRRNQREAGQLALTGLAVSRVRGIPTRGEIWGHVDVPENGPENGLEELARAANLGSTGWVSSQDYLFTIQASSRRLRVFVDGILEIDVEGSFDLGDGRFGFYNFSQPAVVYSAVSSFGATVVEGEEAHISIPFLDGGAADTHTATIDWRDGTVSPGLVLEDAGAGIASGSHLYPDDGLFETEVCVRDDDGAEACGGFPVEVLNLDPSIEVGPDRLAYVGEGLAVAATFTDPGVLDSHTATIDWGDGSTEPGAVAGAGGAGTVAGFHEYGAEGTYTVEVCVSDDDGGEACDGFEVRWLDPVLDLAIRQSANVAHVRPGEIVVFEVSAANEGTREPTGVVVRADLPDLMTFLDGGTGVFDPVTRTVVWTFPFVAFEGAEIVTLTLQAEDTLPFGQSVVHTVTVSDDGSFGPDATPEDNAAEVTLTLLDDVTPRVVADDQVPGLEGEPVDLSATFDDTDSAEIHTAEIDWGDGTVEAGLVEESAGSGIVTGAHVFPDDGVFVGRVCVSDGAGHTGCGFSTIEIRNGAPRVNDDEALDLHLWRHADLGGVPDGNGAQWQVAEDGESVRQASNGGPTVFFGEIPASGTNVGASVEVETSSDDDLIGFVIGLDRGDPEHVGAEYLLVDWKQASQTDGTSCGSVEALEGLALSRVRGVPLDGELFGHLDLDCSGPEHGVDELQRAVNLGATGWEDRREYRFTFRFEDDRLQILVDGVLELELVGGIPAGRLGFYNYSQPAVRYRGFHVEPLIADEGASAPFQASFSDPGTLDTHIVTIAWNDGATSAPVPEFSDGIGLVRDEHTYLDDGVFSIEVCVTDDNGDSDCGSFPATVHNVAPTVDAGPDLAASVGNELVLTSATFVDPGVLDTHSATLAWGDGTVSQALVDEAGGAGTVGGTHVFAAPGSYVVEICVSDDDGGSGCDALVVTVEEPAGVPVIEVRKTDALVDTAGDGEVDPGDVVRYTVTVENTGTAPATAVILADAPPSATSVVAGSVVAGQGTVTGEDPVAVDLGTIAAGSSATVTFDVAIGEPLPPGVEAISNQAVVSSFELADVLSDDPDLPGDADPTVTPVVAPPDLTASKTDALLIDADLDGVPSPGDTLRYTVVIENDGAGGAAGVVFRDLLPDNTALVPGSVATDAGMVVTEDPVEVAIGELPGGSAATVSFDVTIASPFPAGVEEVSNQGTVTSDQLPAVLTDDPQVGGGADPTVTMVTAAPRLLAEKTAALSADADGDGVPSPGDTLVYAVTLRNLGNTVATAVVFLDPIPADTAVVAGSVTVSAGTVVTEDPVEVALAELGAGETVTVGFEVVVADPLPAGVTEVVNQGGLAADGVAEVLTDDPTVGGEADPTVTPIAAAPELLVEKTDQLFNDASGDGDASPGDELLYRIEVASVGNTAATGVALLDLIPADTALVPGTVQSSHGVVVSEDPVEVALGELPSGVTAVVTFRVAVADPFPPAATGVANQATVTSVELDAVLSDDPDTPEAADPTATEVFVTPEVSVDEVTVVEGDGSPAVEAVFTVSLSRATSRAVDVAFATADGTALGGADYTATSGALVIAPGETAATVAVPVTGDLLDEPDETFVLELTAVSGGLLVDASGLGTIADDDDPPAVGVAGPAVTEGDAGTTPAVFPVTLSVPSGFDVAVSYLTVDGTAVAGADYEPVAGSLLIPAGALGGEIVVAVVGDLLDEADELFTVQLTEAENAVLAAPLADGVILDDDEPPTLSIGDVAVSEGDAGSVEAVFTLSLSAASGRTVSVDAATADGTATAGADYTAVAATVIFPAGTTSQTFPVPVLGDVLDEPDEAFTVALSAPLDVTLADPEASGTILDDDEPPQLSVGGVTVTEGTEPEAVLTVSLSAPSGFEVSVAYATGDGTATAGVDYAAAAGSLVFPAGTTEKTVSVAVLDDALDEGAESFSLILSDAQQAVLPAAPAVVTILDDDPEPQLSIGGAAVAEGAPEAVFALTLSTPSGRQVSVAYATADGTAAAGSDYAAVSGALAFPAGSTSQSVAVPVLDDGIDEPDETFTLVLSAPENALLADASGVATILDDDEPPTLSIGDTAVIEGDAGTTEAAFTLSLSAASGFEVAVSAATVAGTATSGVDFLATSEVVTIPAGDLSATFGVPVVGDLVDELEESFTAVLSDADNAILTGATGLGTIVDDDEAVIAIGDVEVAEGDAGTADVLFTVSLATEADRTLEVAYATVAGTATEGEDYLAVAGILTFAAGTTAESVAVPVVGDTLLEAEVETFFVELADPVETTIADGTGEGRIVDDEACAGPELLENPSAEAFLEGGEIPGWAEVSGSDWQRRTAPPDPVEGEALFWAGTEALAELVQEVDVSAYAARVAEGTQRFAFEGYVRTAEEDPSDVARIVVEYRDAAGTVVLDAFDSGEIASPFGWQPVADARAAPVGTGRIRVRLLATRFNPGDTDGYFDALSLRSLRAPVVTIGDVTVYEGHAGTVDADFPVRLSCAYEREVSVAFATADGTAVSPEDYAATFGTLVFPVGTTEQAVAVPVVADEVEEPHESFTVELSGLTGEGALLLDPVGEGTILDDDFCPRSHGYWKNHTELWPVDRMVIGAVELDAGEMLILLQSGGSDASNKLGLQLVATKLNLAAGSDPFDPPILDTVAAADAFLSVFPPGSNPGGEDKQLALDLKDVLDAYNNSGECE